MFSVSEKTVTIFTVDGDEFDNKKDALRHVAWKNLEFKLTDNGWACSIEHMLKNDPSQAILLLGDYSREINQINQPENLFRYDNIKWDALATTINHVTMLPYDFHSWAEVVDRLNTYIDNNQKINAIKLVRIAFGTGLRESKDWVEDRWTSREFDIF